MVKTGSRCLLALAAVACVGGPVRGQYSSPGGIKWDNPYGAALDASLAGAVQKGIFARRELRSAAAPVLCFKPAARPIAVEPIARQLGRTDEERKALAEAFAGILRALEEECRKDSDDPNPHDLAKAYAFFVAANYTVLHPGTDLGIGTTRSLVHQFRGVLLEAGESAKADDRAKQSVWETLVILAGFTGAGYAQAVQDKDKPAADAMQALARESLKTLLKVDPDEVTILEGKMLPLSLTPKAVPLAANAAGPLQVGWLAFTPPAGWKVQKAGEGLILTPGDLKEGESLTVAIVQADEQVKWHNAEYFAWRTITGKEVYDDAVEFPDPVSRSSVLPNGWSARIQVGKLKRGGWAMPLILQADPNRPILFVLTVAGSADVMNRHKGTVTDLFTRGSRLGKDKPVGIRGPGLSGVWMGFAPLMGSYEPSPRWVTFFDDAQTLNDLPRTGLVDFDRAASKADSISKEFWGSYTYRDGEGTIEKPRPKLPIRIRAVPGKPGQIMLDSVAYFRCTRVDGLRLDGAWTSYADPADPTLSKRPLGQRPVFRFTRDGRFSDEGVFATFLHSYGPDAATLDAHGNGTYEIRDFTLLLRYSDGRLRQTAFTGLLNADPAAQNDIIYISRGRFNRIK